MIMKKADKALMVYRPLKDIQSQNSITTKCRKDRIFFTSQKSCAVHTRLPKQSPSIFPNICVIIHSSFIDENKLTSIILSHDNLPRSMKMLIPFHRLLCDSFVSDCEAIESAGEC